MCTRTRYRFITNVPRRERNSKEKSKVEAKEFVVEERLFCNILIFNDLAGEVVYDRRIY